MPKAAMPLPTKGGHERTDETISEAFIAHPSGEGRG
jgi:hypothetical protein